MFMKYRMRFYIFLCLFLTACHFSPLYNQEAVKGVCVAPIPEASGSQMRTYLQQYFPETSHCLYTLKVTAPIVSLSDQSISDKDFITTQQIKNSTSYSLLDKDKKVILKNTLSSKASSSVIANPYSTVIATEKTEYNLNASLAEQIALHVAAFLDREKQ